MPPDQDPGAQRGDDGPRLSRWERLKYTLVQPDDDPSDEAPADRSLEEVEFEIHRSTDKERNVGFVAAPVAAIVGVVISSASLDYARTHDLNQQPYRALTYVLLGLAVLIMVASMLRKRLFQGITLALFGLAVFQLHYTYVGFAAPFILAGAWYMVRSYRLQQELKRLEGGGSPSGRKGGSPSNGTRPRQSKRYTPPS